MSSKTQTVLSILGFCLYYIYLFLHLAALVFVVTNQFGSFKNMYTARPADNLISNDGLTFVKIVISDIALCLINGTCIIALLASVFVALPTFCEMYVLWIESHGDGDYYSRYSFLLGSLGVRTKGRHYREKYLYKYWPYSLYYDYVNRRKMLQVADKLTNFLVLLLDLNVEQNTIKTLLKEIRKPLFISSDTTRAAIQDKLIFIANTLDGGERIKQALNDLWTTYSEEIIEEDCN